MLRNAKFKQFFPPKTNFIQLNWFEPVGLRRYTLLLPQTRVSMATPDKVPLSPPKHWPPYPSLLLLSCHNIFTSFLSIFTWLIKSSCRNPTTLMRAKSLFRNSLGYVDVANVCWTVQSLVLVEPVQHMAPLLPTQPSSTERSFGLSVLIEAFSTLPQGYDVTWHYPPILSHVMTR